MKLPCIMSGEFVTKLARKWYYEEYKDYKKSEELLLMCMEGMGLDNEELKNNVRDIMIGKSKLKGNENTEGLYIDEDNFDIFVFFNKLLNDLKNEKETRIKCQEKLNKIFEDISNDKLYYDPIYEGDLLIESFNKAKKTDNNYGWLHPSGEFIPVGWSEHQQWALDYIKNNKKLLDEYMSSNFARAQAAGDFLIEVKGWVLLHNPAQGVARPKYNKVKKLNKKQREFLNNYYIERGEIDLAIICRY